MKTVLISGATGLVGKKLKDKLLAKNHTVRLLSRKKAPGFFHWNPTENYIEEAAFENLDAIIHLAGSPISERWTKNYKQELFDSRIKTADLLFDHTKKYAPSLQTFITASGSNYYGTVTTRKTFTETHVNGNDFLGMLCLKWENAGFQFESLGTRAVALRTAAVLSENSGVLKKLMPLAKLNLASPLGSGKQFMPWIHIDDLTNIYLHALENETLSGAYNAASPQAVTNREFTKTLTGILGKSVLLPNVPAWVLKSLLGEMSSIALEGSAVSSEKIINAGYQFQFTELSAALKNLIKSDDT